MRDRRLRTAATVLLGLALTACGGDGSNGLGPGNGDDPEDGSFSATVTGGIEATFSGEALHAEAMNPDTGEQAWVLFMTSAGTGDANSICVLRLGARPGTGTYSLIDLESEGELDPDELGAILTLDVGQFGFGAFSADGTVTITSSSASRVEGTFEIEVTGVDASTQQPVTATATGDFEAVDGLVGYPAF